MRKASKRFSVIAGSSSEKGGKPFLETLWDLMR
jgi:hypothetical protein